MMPLYFSVG